MRALKADIHERASKEGLAFLGNETSKLELGVFISLGLSGVHALAQTLKKLLVRLLVSLIG